MVSIACSLLVLLSVLVLSVVMGCCYLNVPGILPRVDSPTASAPFLPVLRRRVFVDLAREISVVIES